MLGCLHGAASAHLGGFLGRLATSVKIQPRRPLHRPRCIRRARWKLTRYVKIQPVLPAKGRVGVLKTNAKKPS